VNVIPRLRVVRSGCQRIEASFVIDTRRSTFWEIAWRLTRLRGRGRDPFLDRLPISTNEYDKEYKVYPIDDFQAVFDHNVHFLVDKPGRVFVEWQTTKLPFGSVWMPKHALIFKGTFSLPPSFHSR
jgi:hypothetical protein